MPGGHTPFPASRHPRGAHSVASLLLACWLSPRRSTLARLRRRRNEVPMQVRAAVAFAPGQPLSIESVELAGPREGEALVELKATGVCHTDEYTLSGKDPEGIFPAILGHEGAGIVVDVGPGVRSVAKGDHV